MSFGFSVGDILLLSQLSYKLYGILTSDRQSAPSTLRELSTSVFGLHCALEHLSQHLSTLKLPPGNTKIHVNLSLMITSCGDTLGELDAALKSYEEKVIVKGKGTREKVKREWNRVKWAAEENRLSEIRGKIMQHADGIQMILGTFVWADVRDGREEVRNGTEKMEKLLEKIVEDGREMRDMMDKGVEKVINDMHRLIATNATYPTTPSQPYQKSIQRSVGFGAGSASISLPPPWVAGMSAVQHIPTASSTIPASIPEFKMSSLEEINRERAVAAKLQPNHISTRESAIPPPTPKRPNAQTDMPSIGTYSVVECRAANSGAHSRSHFHPSDISPIARSVCTFSSPSQWLTNCESTIQHWTTASRALAREETKRRTLVAVNMLAELNEYLSGIRSKEERKRYRGLLEGERFEKALLKMKTVCNGSVMLRKQVEVYEDDKEDDVAG